MLVLGVPTVKRLLSGSFFHYALQFANLMSKCNSAPNQKRRKVALVLRHIYNEQN